MGGLAGGLVRWTLRVLAMGDDIWLEPYEAYAVRF